MNLVNKYLDLQLPGEKLLWTFPLARPVLFVLYLDKEWASSHVW